MNNFTILIAKIFKWFEKKDKLTHDNALHYANILYLNKIINKKSFNNIHGYIIVSWAHRDRSFFYISSFHI